MSHLLGGQEGRVVSTGGLAVFRGVLPEYVLLMCASLWWREHGSFDGS
jgi:hypothetical protein